MASRKFELEIDLKSNKAEKDLKKFNKTLDDTNKKTKESKKSTDNAKGGFAGFASALGPATKALAGMGAAAVAGVAAYNALDQGLRRSAESARNIVNFARVADTTTESFQAMEIVAKRFGVTGEKLADQVKDFQDKLGDFTQHGAGPFVDIFKQIGNTSDLTADKLAAMAGPQAVGAVITALEGANLTTSEMKQALEALASDLVLTQDAFGNNGKAISDMTAQLKEMNAVLTTLEIQQLKEYADSVELIDKQWDTWWARLKLDYAPAMKGLNVIISDFLKMTSKDSNNLFDGTETDIQRVDKLKKSIAELTKEFDKIESRTGSDRDESSGDLTRVGSLLSRREAELAIEQEQIAVKKAKAEKIVNDELSRRELINQTFIEQNQQIVDSQKAMSTGLAKYNEELKRTAYIEAELKKSGADKFSKEQYATIKKNIENFYDNRVKLTQAEKDAATAVKELAKEEEELFKAVEKQIDLNIARTKGFTDLEKSMRRELALLNATNDAERTRLELKNQAEDLQLTKVEASTIEGIQAQIDARQKHLDMLEDEKEAVQSLAEAMGRWASGSKDAVKQVIAELIRLVAIRAFGGTGSFGGGFLTGFGSGGMNGYAEGGNFKSGETFMVGEAGPEIITASAPGSVIPNHQLGGGQGISISPQLVINGGVNGVDELSTMFTQFSNEIATQTNQLIKTQLGPRGVFA